jgi:hypothetical protein
VKFVFHIKIIDLILHTAKKTSSTCNRTGTKIFALINMRTLKKADEALSVSFGKRRKKFRRKQKLKQFIQHVMKLFMIEITVHVMVNMMF